MNRFPTMLSPPNVQTAFLCSHDGFCATVEFYAKPSNGMGCTTDQGSPTSHYRRHRSYRALAAERRDGAPARMRGNAMIITFTTPAEFRDLGAAWDRRAKEATSAEDHKMMLY